MLKTNPFVVQSDPLTCLAVNLQQEAVLEMDFQDVVLQLGPSIEIFAVAHRAR